MTLYGDRISINMSNIDSFGMLGSLEGPEPRLADRCHAGKECTSNFDADQEHIEIFRLQDLTNISDYPQSYIELLKEWENEPWNPVEHGDEIFTKEHVDRDDPHIRCTVEDFLPVALESVTFEHRTAEDIMQSFCDWTEEQKIVLGPSDDKYSYFWPHQPDISKPDVAMGVFWNRADLTCSKPELERVLEPHHCKAQLRKILATCDPDKTRMKGGTRVDGCLAWVIGPPGMDEL